MTAIAALLCAATIYTDFVYRKVPNAVLAAVLLAAGTVIALGHAHEPSLSVRAAGMLLGIVVTLPVYALGRMAAGDVKFLAVAGLFAGPAGLITVWVSGSLLGMLHAIALALRGGLRAGAGTAPAQTGSGSTDAVPARGVPYAGYMAMGMLAWMTFGG